MYRDAEKQFKSAIADQPMIDMYLYLAKVYIRLDQPLAAIDVYKQGLVKFPQEVSLLLGQARVHEVRTYRFDRHVRDHMLQVFKGTFELVFELTTIMFLSPGSRH